MNKIANLNLYFYVEESGKKLSLKEKLHNLSTSFFYWPIIHSSYYEVGVQNLTRRRISKEISNVDRVLSCLKIISIATLVIPIISLILIKDISGKVMKVLKDFYSLMDRDQKKALIAFVFDDSYREISKFKKDSPLENGKELISVWFLHLKHPPYSDLVKFFIENEPDFGKLTKEIDLPIIYDKLRTVFEEWSCHQKYLNKLHHILEYELPVKPIGLDQGEKKKQEETTHPLRLLYEKMMSEHELTTDEKIVLKALPLGKFKEFDLNFETSFKTLLEIWEPKNQSNAAILEAFKLPESQHNLLLHLETDQIKFLIAQGGLELFLKKFCKTDDVVLFSQAVLTELINADPKFEKLRFYGIATRSNVEMHEVLARWLDATIILDSDQFKKNLKSLQVRSYVKEALWKIYEARQNPKSKKQHSITPKEFEEIKKNFLELGMSIDKQYTEEEIKKVYHKKALQFHPDKNPNTDATNKFQAIQSAEEALLKFLKENNLGKTPLFQTVLTR